MCLEGPACEKIIYIIVLVVTAVIEKKIIGTPKTHILHKHADTHEPHPLTHKLL